jgi:hypothetical protein
MNFEVKTTTKRIQRLTIKAWQKLNKLKLKGKTQLKKKPNTYMLKVSITT